MGSVKTNKFGAKVLDSATQSLINFNSEAEQTELLMLFIKIGDGYISGNKENAKQALIEIYEDNNNEASQKLVSYFKTEDANKLFNMQFYEKHFSQMAYSRSLDNFITYLKEILAEIVIKKPHVLKSKDMERLDFILEYDNMDDLLKAISEKKIEELFYKGINDIEKFFQERLGIKIFKSIKIKNDINRLIKQRNLIVHNRSRISKQFVDEFRELNYQVGSFLTFTYEDISKGSLIIHNFLVDLDIEISNKFELKLHNVLHFR